MSWTIHKRADDTYEAVNAGDLKARMVNSTAETVGAAEHWVLTFPGAPALNWDATNIDRAIGYVRGIERAATVHAEETRQPVRRARR